MEIKPEDWAHDRYERQCIDKSVKMNLAGFYIESAISLIRSACDELKDYEKEILIQPLIKWKKELEQEYHEFRMDLWDSRKHRNSL